MTLYPFCTSAFERNKHGRKFFWLGSTRGTVPQAEEGLRLGTQDTTDQVAGASVEDQSGRTHRGLDRPLDRITFLGLGSCSKCGWKSPSSWAGTTAGVGRAAATTMNPRPCMFNLLELGPSSQAIS